MRAGTKVLRGTDLRFDWVVRLRSAIIALVALVLSQSAFAQTPPGTEALIEEAKKAGSTVIVITPEDQSEAGGSAGTSHRSGASGRRGSHVGDTQDRQRLGRACLSREGRRSPRTARMDRSDGCFRRRCLLWPLSGSERWLRGCWLVGFAGISPPRSAGRQRQGSNGCCVCSAPRSFGSSCSSCFSRFPCFLEHFSGRATWPGT